MGTKYDEVYKQEIAAAVLDDMSSLEAVATAYGQPVRVVSRWVNEEHARRQALAAQSNGRVEVAEEDEEDEEGDDYAEDDALVESVIDRLLAKVEIKEEANHACSQCQSYRAEARVLWILVDKLLNRLIK